MGDLDRRSRKLVHGWPSGGLVVGLLPDSSHREWSGKAALELATAAAQDRLAALVLDLAPDATDLASRFGADPEPGFAQVMTGEVELSQIQHWDAARGAYYLPGGVRVLSDKVAKSRSVEALAKRVRGQEGILFVLLDRHAAEAAAETGWLDGVVRLGQADLGGPKMFGEVTALGRLERRATTTSKPWEREESDPAATEPTSGPADQPTTTGDAEGAGDADLTVESEGPVDGGAPGETPGPREVEPEGPSEPERPLEPAASAETDGPEAPGGAEVPAESPDSGAEVTDGQPALEVSDETWEPDVAARTEVLDRPDRGAAEADEKETDDPSVVDITDAAEPDSGEEERDEADAEPPVLEVSDALWEPRETEEPGITDEPEIAAQTHEVDAGDETAGAGEEAAEAGEPEALETADEPAQPEVPGAAEVEAEEEPAGPEVAPEEGPTEEVLGVESAGQSEVTESPVDRPEGEAADEETPRPEIVAEHPDEEDAAEPSDEPEVGEEAELRPEEERGEPEVAETADESAGTETADGAEVEADDEPAGPEIGEEGRPEEEVQGPEVGAEPEIPEAPAEDSDERTAEVGGTGDVAEPEVDSDESGDPELTEESGAPEIEEEPVESEIVPGEEPSEAEVGDGFEITESPGETGEEELDRPAGLERFAEIPDEDEAPASEKAPAAGAAEEVGEEDEAREAEETDGYEEDGEKAASTEPVSEPRGDEDVEEVLEPDERVHAEVITSGLDVWPEEADEPVASGEAADSKAADAPAEGEGTAASVISAAVWASPEEDGEIRNARETENADFISPAMWVADADEPGEEASSESAPRAADVMSRGQWAPGGKAAETTEHPVETGDAGEADATRETDETTASEEPVETEGDEDEESADPQRADFILDGLELPPEWSEEWEEEERAAAEAGSETEPAEGQESQDEPEAEAGEEAADQADFVTQGMGIPDDEGEDDPWPDSGTSGDRERSGSGTSGGGTWGTSGGSDGGSWERDPYGGSGGRAAAATAAAGGGGAGSSGLALQRRGTGQSGLWKRARTAVLVLLAVGAVGALGSAVLDSGAVSALRDVVATAGGGTGGGSSSGSGGSGAVAAAGAGGSGPGAAAPDSATSPPTDATQGESSSETSAANGTPAEGDRPRLVSEEPGFGAVTDSLASAIEEYDEQIDLYREGTIGCPLLMSAREETGRLFVRLSMFRLSGGARPDSLFRRTYRRFSEDMESVEGTYRQTQCPRPSTAPRESAAAELPPADSAPSESTGIGPATDSLPSDSVRVGGDSLSDESAVADSLPDDTVPMDSLPAGDAPTDAGAPGSATDSLPAGEVEDTVPSDSSSAESDTADGLSRG